MNLKINISRTIAIAVMILIVAQFFALYEKTLHHWGASWIVVVSPIIIFAGASVVTLTIMFINSFIRIIRKNSHKS